MTTIGMAAGYAMLVWWFTTGIILFLDGLPQRTFPWSMAGATVLLGLAAYMMRASAGDVSPGGAFTAFSCAIMVWGWLEMTFLMGFITGPRKQACRDKCSGAAHFLHATQAIIYNELATLSAALLIFAATAGSPNRVAFWTYLVLWSMRLSAKLNLFFGVPNTGDQFLPPHLLYLKSFFNKRRMNFLFPISITASTIAAVVLVQKCLAVDDVFQVTGYALVASLLILAILEHWFMVLPLPTEKLWAWGMRNTGAAPRLDPSRIVAKSP
jgi:putative photosynthetic complex assembly protein 2